MVYNDEEILRAIQLRCFSKIIVGTLCKATDDITSALQYFDIEAYNGTFTNPYTSLPTDMIMQMTSDLVRYIGMVTRKSPIIFTIQELIDIQKVCKTHGYLATILNQQIHIRI